MVNCTITENYFKEKARMVQTNNYGCDINCSNCPLAFYNNGYEQGCGIFEAMHPEDAIAIIQKWSNEHPQKTYKQDFFEKFPNAPKGKSGCPRGCRELMYGRTKCAGKSCVACWNEEISERNENDRDMKE